MTIAAGTLDALRKLPLRARRAALAAAFRHGLPDERAALALSIIDLADDPDASGASEIVPLLSSEPPLDRPIRVAMLDAIRSALPGLMDSLISRPDNESRHAAFRLAAFTAIELHDPAGRIGPILRTPTIRIAVDEVLARGADAYPDHRISVVLEALWRSAHDPGPALRRFFLDPGHPASLPLRSSARAHAHLQPIRRLVIWLGVPSLAPIAREALQQRASAALSVTKRLKFLTSLYDCAHLLSAGSRAAEVRRLAGPERFCPGPEELESLPASARRGAIGWLRVLPIKRENLRAILSLYSRCTPEDCGEPAGRLEAVRLLASLEPSASGDQILREFAENQEPAVAGAAVASLASAVSPSRRKALAPFLDSLSGSPHPAVRRVVDQARRHRNSPRLLGPELRVRSRAIITGVPG